MQKKFLSNLGFLIFVNIIVKPVYIFGIDRVIQNTLGEEVYGSYYAILKFALIISILLDLGIENFNRRDIAQNDNIIDKYFSNFLIIKLLLGLVYISIAFFGAYVSGYSFPELKLLLFILINEFLRSMVMYLRANLGGLHKFKTDSVFSVLDRILMIIVCGFLLINKKFSENFKIEWFIFSQTFAYGTSVVIAFFAVYKNIKIFKPGINRNYNIALFKQLSPFALLVFLMSIYTHIDPFILERLLPDGKHQAGIYAHSARILEACSNYSYLFAIILLPIFSKMIQKKQSIEKILSLSYFLIIIPSLLAVACFYIFRVEIIALLYNNESSISPQIFGTLMFSLLGLGTTYIYGTLLTANGNLKQLILISSIGVLVSISLNLILVPTLKGYGSALANVSSQIITAILQIILAHYIFKTKYKFGMILQLPIFFIVVFFSGYYFHSVSSLNWLLKFSIILTSGVILSLLMVRKDLFLFLKLVRNENT